MSGLYSWISGILCFFIFVTMIQNLLPSRQYEKYLRFFAGMVLILLVMQPLLGTLRLEDRIAYYFETINFQNDTQDLSREILGIEQSRLEKVIDSYEEALEWDVELMVRDVGAKAKQVEVEIDSDQESGTYGMVKGVRIRIEKPDGEHLSEHGAVGRGQESGAAEKLSENGMAGTSMEEGSKEGEVFWEKESGVHVELEEILVEEIEISEKNGENGSEEASAEEAVGLSIVSSEQIAELRRRVEQYYGLESNKVEITYQGR